MEGGEGRFNSLPCNDVVSAPAIQACSDDLGKGLNTLLYR